MQTADCWVSPEFLLTATHSFRPLHPISQPNLPFIFSISATLSVMMRRKQAASEEEDLPDVQKQSKTRAQTRQRADEEGQYLMGMARGMFEFYSVAL